MVFLLPFSRHSVSTRSCEYALLLFYDHSSSASRFSGLVVTAVSCRALLGLLGSDYDLGEDRRYDVAALGKLHTERHDLFMMHDWEASTPGHW